MQRTWNSLYNLLFTLVAVLAALPPDVLNVLPGDWKPYVIGACGVAVWIKSHGNLFINPDGTPASVAYKEQAK